jgi:hypothetical protein
VTLGRRRAFRGLSLLINELGQSQNSIKGGERKEKKKEKKGGTVSVMIRYQIVA